MKKNIYIMALTALMSFTSCDDFLSHDPDNRGEISSPSDISKLLVSAYPDATYAMFCESMSDNAGDRGPNAVMQERWNEQPYFWEDCSDTYQETPTYFWMESYVAIAAANHALEAIEKLEAEGRGDEVKASRGEALLCRAFSHFMLANIFAMPYNPATADRELGIPYITKPETTMQPEYKRETLAETYRLIEEDLIEGLRYIQDEYSQPSYHFTKTAAYAFASRYYLWKGGEENWKEALRYANLALGDVATIDPTDKLRATNDNSSDYNGDYYDAQALYTASSEKANLLLCSCISNMYYQPYVRYGLSTSIRYGVIESEYFGYELSYKIYGAKDFILHLSKWRQYFKQSSMNAETGLNYTMYPYLVTEEVLFNRAEANALLGNYDDARTDINYFMKKRIKNYKSQTISHANVLSYYPKRLAANLPKLNPYFADVIEEKGDSCFSYVQAILALRRVEFVGEGMRWFDIKRYDIPVTHKKYDGGEITLPAGDKRRACQIPEAAIADGIEPNPVNANAINEADKAAAATLSAQHASVNSKN